MQKTQHQPTTYVLYIDLSTVVKEEVHRIYRILPCSGSWTLGFLSTLLPPISRVWDPLYEHN